MTAPKLRGDGRLQAKAVPDSAVLEACVGWQAGGRFPLDSLAGRYPDVPRKVLVAKARKLEQRGWMKGWVLTKEGLEAMREASE